MNRNVQANLGSLLIGVYRPTKENKKTLQLSIDAWPTKTIKSNRIVYKFPAGKTAFQICSANSSELMPHKKTFFPFESSIKLNYRVFPPFPSRSILNHTGAASGNYPINRCERAASPKICNFRYEILWRTSMICSEATSNGKLSPR